MRSSLIPTLIILILSGCQSSAQVIKLTGDNWKQVLSGEWMIKFYAPWCPACKNIAELWKDFAAWAEERDDVKVAEVDVTQDEALGAQFMITALPTIYHIKNGQFRKFTAPITISNFQAYITNENWKNADPLPWWKAPSSITMVGLGYLYKGSMLLKALHQTLMTDYNIPEYAAYGIIGLGFIIFGLVVALLGSALLDSTLGAPLPNPDVSAEVDMQEHEADGRDQGREDQHPKDEDDHSDKSQGDETTEGKDEEDYVIVDDEPVDGNRKSGSPRKRRIKASTD